MRLKPETEIPKDLSLNNLVNYVSIVDTITLENETNYYYYYYPASSEGMVQRSFFDFDFFCPCREQYHEPTPKFAVKYGTFAQFFGMSILDAS